MDCGMLTCTAYPNLRTTNTGKRFLLLGFLLFRLQSHDTGLFAQTMIYMYIYITVLLDMYKDSLSIVYPTKP